METILNKVKLSKLGMFLMSNTGKKIIGTALFSGIGIALPRIFHVLAGSSAGATFLPMHICVLIAALVFGCFSATTVAGVSVLFSYLLTGMPSIERLPYMLMELVLYAVILGLLNKKFSPYISLIGTILLGRIVYAGILFLAGNVFGFSLAGLMNVWQAAITGIYGIAIQLIFVPVIAKQIKKGVKINESFTKS